MSHRADNVNLVRRGELDPEVANTVGYLASVLLRSLERGRTEERVAGVAVTGSTVRERYKSMWLIEKENEMRQSFEAEAAAASAIAEQQEGAELGVGMRGVPPYSSRVNENYGQRVQVPKKEWVIARLNEIRALCLKGSTLGARVTFKHPNFG